QLGVRLLARARAHLPPRRHGPPGPALVLGGARRARAAAGTAGVGPSAHGRLRAGAPGREARAGEPPRRRLHAPGLPRAGRILVLPGLARLPDDRGALGLRRDSPDA